MCAYCGDRIWGLGQQGYKCNACKLLIHKRCAPSVDFHCGEVPPAHEVVRQRPVTVSGTGNEGKSTMLSGIALWYTIVCPFSWSLFVQHLHFMLT